MGDEAAALADGKTQDEIDAYKAKMAGESKEADAEADGPQASPVAFARRSGAAQTADCVCCEHEPQLPMNPAAEAAALREMVALREEFMSGGIAGLCDLTEPYIGPIFPQVLTALARLKTVTEDPMVQKLAKKRLTLNELAFDTYHLDQEPTEREQMGAEGAGESFYSVAKVDTHLHLSACMTTHELYDYLSEIYTVHGEREFKTRDGTSTTIGEMMQAEGFTTGTSTRGATDLDAMGTLAHKDMFSNFEAFNQAFNPLNSKPLKDLIFKPRTLDGEFMRGFITRVVDKAKTRNTFLEPRISIKGKTSSEWPDLAKWVYAHRSELDRKHLLWGVQLPRVYQIHHGRKVTSFGELITNWWAPLFAATQQPDEHVELAWFLERCAIIDTVDNEDKVDEYDLSNMPPASEWTGKANPPYGYYHFYFWANLRALNKLRDAKGMRLLTLRPHCGEAGPVHHLASAFLFADNISHGINLRKAPTLEYLYYLAQIGVSVSPISNKSLFIPYLQNPFPHFFKRGLHVTLSTDDPLMFHMTPTPLLEEYAAARVVWNFTMVDLCEIARASVLISSMPAALKATQGKEDIAVSNVPPCRFAFRRQVMEGNRQAMGLI